MIDLLQEIYATIRMNKLRTFLTGFAVAWGIFILIVLLGSGNGLLNAFKESSGIMNFNAITIYPSRTTKPHGGFQQGRPINLDETDISAVGTQLSDNLYNESGVISQGDMIIRNKDKSINGTLMGVASGFIKNQGLTLKHGRFVNEEDIKEKRRSIVLHEKAIEILFGENIDATGKTIELNKTVFLVVGISADLGFNDYRTYYSPITTVKQIFNKDKLSNISFISKNLSSIEESEKLTQDIRTTLANKHNFSADDWGAVWVSNRFTSYLQQQTASGYLTIAIWIIGIFTLLSGIVGVSNIMLISVKERTREFGIRKAIGAKPSSILRLILFESVIITTVFGYIGMLAGILTTEWMSIQAGKQVVDVGVFSQTVFTDPTVDIGVAVQATIALIIAGTIAGFIPARKAVSVKPIEALNAR